MFETKDYVTVSIAVFGAALSLWNTWRASQDKAVRLKVIPQASWPAAGGALTSHDPKNLIRLTRANGLPTVTIEVVNLSTFPLVISEIGLQERDLSSRSPIHNPVCKREHALPAKLDARASATWIASPNFGDYTFTDKTRVYARTACGKLILSGKPFMVALRDAVRDWKNQHEKDVQEVYGRLGFHQ